MASCTCAGSGCPPPTLGVFGEARGASLGLGFEAAVSRDLGAEGAFGMGAAAAAETKAAGFGVAPPVAGAAFGAIAADTLDVCAGAGRAKAGRAGGFACSITSAGLGLSAGFAGVGVACPFPGFAAADFGAAVAEAGMADDAPHDEVDDCAAACACLSSFGNWRLSLRYSLATPLSKCWYRMCLPS